MYCGASVLPFLLVFCRICCGGEFFFIIGAYDQVGGDYETGLVLMQESSADKSGVDLIVDIGGRLYFLLTFLNKARDIIAQQTKAFLGIADDYTFAVSPHTSRIAESFPEVNDCYSHAVVDDSALNIIGQVGDFACILPRHYKPYIRKTHGKGLVINGKDKIFITALLQCLHLQMCCTVIVYSHTAGTPN